MYVSYKERTEMGVWTWQETVIQDLRYGIRELARYKGFTATAILSLAMGIMASTAMYSVIYGVILEPFPYKDVDNLVSIAIRNPEQRGWRGSYSVEEYAELVHRSTIFEGVAASTISDVLWMSNGEPLRLRGNHISNNGFDVMGVPALFGRTVTGTEADPETKAVLDIDSGCGSSEATRLFLDQRLYSTAGRERLSASCRLASCSEELTCTSPWPTGQARHRKA
jgi:hypothetical protein